MFPVLANFGPLTIYSFGLLLGLGLLAGTYHVWKHGRAASLPEERLLDGTFLTVLGGLAGARALYVLSNLPLYAEDLLSVIYFWKGGLSFWGALLGGVLTIMLLSRKFRWPSGQMFDLAAPAVALGSFFGYIGAFLNASSYGGETAFIWGIPQQGLTGLRHPSQLLEAVLQLIIFITLVRARKNRPFAGYLAILYLSFYSLGRFILEFFRGDQTHLTGPLSQAHFISVFVGTICLLLLYLRLARLRGSWRVNIWKEVTGYKTYGPN